MPTTELRRQRTLRLLSGWVCSVSLAVLGLAQFETHFEQALGVKIPDLVFPWIVVLASAGTAVGVLLWMASWLWGSRSVPYFLSQNLSPAEVGALRRYAVSFFGESFASEARMIAWLARCKDCVIVVKRIRRKNLQVREDICGFFILLPLTRHAAELYKRKEITGATFLDEHIPTTSADTYAVYIAALAGNEQHACNSATLLLHRALLHHLEHGVRLVLTRPTSPRGQELAAEFGMLPVPGTELDGHPLYERVE